MPIKESLEAMKLFNERAGELRHSPFTEYINKRLNRVNIKYSEEGLSIDRKGPSNHDIKAFILTFRSFIQDNERCSFRNMAKHYETLSIPNEFKQLFRGLRKGHKSFLSEGSSMVVYEGERLKFNEIFDTFIYGKFAHTEKPKKEKYDKWMKDPIRAVLLELDFIFILSGMLRNIFAVEALNNEVINYIKENKDKLSA